MILLDRGCWIGFMVVVAYCFDCGAFYVFVYLFTVVCDDLVFRGEVTC